MGLVFYKDKLEVDGREKREKIDKQKSMVSAVPLLPKPCRVSGGQGSSKRSHEARTGRQRGGAIRKVEMSILLEEHSTHIPK